MIDPDTILPGAEDREAQLEAEVVRLRAGMEELIRKIERSHILSSLRRKYNIQLEAVAEARALLEEP